MDVIVPTRRRKVVEVDHRPVHKLRSTISRRIIIVEHPRTIWPVNRRQVRDTDERPVHPPCIFRSTSHHI